MFWGNFDNLSNDNEKRKEDCDSALHLTFMQF